MGYYGYRHMRRKNTAPRQDNPALVARIEKTVAHGTSVMTDWERNFLGSLLDSAKKWGRLTAKQHEVFQRIEKKLDPEVQKARKDWNQGWSDEMAEKARFAAKYYKSNPPYFGDAAERILNDSSYIPPEKLYRKMVENKYVQRALQNAQTGPLYEVGSMVTVRDAASVVGPIRRFRGKNAVVIEVNDNLSATKGARVYKVLPIGSVTPVNTEERYLKKSRI